MPRKRKAQPAAPASDDIDLARREAAELLGLNPDTLTPGERLKCELIAALRASVDDELAKVTSANAADLGRLIVAVETLTKFLGDAKPKADETPHIYRRDPKQVLQEMVERWIAADEASKADAAAERVALGLPEDERDARIAALEAENKRLRGEAPLDGDVIPPGEVGEFYVGGPKRTPDDEKALRPKPVIEGKVEGSWTGPKDGPCPWLKQPAPVAKRVAEPIVTKSGAETEAQRLRVNSDRQTPLRIMSQGGGEKFPQPDAGGFHWGGSKGRAW